MIIFIAIPSMSSATDAMAVFGANQQAVCGAVHNFWMTAASVAHITTRGNVQIVFVIQLCSTQSPQIPSVHFIYTQTMI